MDKSDISSAEPSRSSTPNPRFTSQASTTEDVLKEQTVGLVHLSDFRKRRAEAIDAKDRAAYHSGTSTPGFSDSGAKPLFKKKKKATKVGGLSFGNDEDDDASVSTSSTQISRATTPGDRTTTTNPSLPADGEDVMPIKKRLTANSAVGIAPKSMTKSALMRETQMKEELRKEFLVMQEAVKATEFIVPFVFYDGKNIPGGTCRMKKGDMIWLFLDRARKVGAEKGVGGSEKSRKEWARVGVDDLMMVRGDLIIPHHYTFHHFLMNKTVGYNGVLFSHSAEPTSATPAETSTPSTPGGLSVPDPLSKASKSRIEIPVTPQSDLEGYDEDPSLTKVVDRRWYEKNKHIFPASTWEDFDPTKTYTSGARKDGEGNVFFATR